jgi:hypothetical protein
MRFSGTSRAKIWAILLALVFLAAQFHFCADLSAGNAGGHFCPFCSTAGVAIATYVPVLELAPVAARLEVHPVEAPVSTGTAHSISPRAPPAL